MKGKNIMAIEKNLKTRIVLTHDEYSALKGKVLKAGEVVLAKVGNTEANGKVSEPIWMMKVGDGTSTVESCPWLVAPAADVYEWAKKSSLDVNDIPTLPISKIDGLSTALNAKATKVTNATSGNFAGLDANGDLTDSGKRADDFAEAGHNHDDVYKKIQTSVAEVGAVDKTLKVSQNAQGVITATPVDIQIAESQVTGLTTKLAGKADTSSLGALASKSTVAEGDLDDALKEKVNAAAEGNHSHLNKDVLDDITSDKVSKWDEVASIDFVNTYAPIKTQAEAETNTRAIAAIKDDADIDSFADVKAELAKKQDTIPANTYDAYGSAADVLGDSSDTATEYTVYGAHAAAAKANDNALDAGEVAARAEGKIDTFLASVTPAGSDAIIDTLQEINEYVGEHGEEFAALSGRVTNIENGTTVVPKASDANTLDGKDSSEFATKAQGAKADTAVQEVVTGATSGTIKVDGEEVKVAGFDTLANTVNITHIGELNRLSGAIDAINYAELPKKADKVTNATEGNFAGLDKDGNLTDSGKKAGDFATAAQGALADSAVQSVSLASGTNNGTVKLTVDGVDNDNIAVKGLGTAAYKNEADFVSAADGLELNNAINGATAAATSAVEKIGVNAWNESAYKDSTITAELTRIDGEIADLEAASATHLTEITTTANGGLKVTGKNQIDIDTDIVFVLDGGTAKDLI